MEMLLVPEAALLCRRRDVFESQAMVEAGQRLLLYVFLPFFTLDSLVQLRISSYVCRDFGVYGG